MGYSKEQLLAQLQELQIDYSRYDHPVVMTVEAQATHIGHLGGGVSKNLFLKDKKNRFYVVSALSGTTVDLKVLSQRLGLGKGGLRMAPEETLQPILQVPLGCVTPFALVNDSARNVSLLLDQGFRAQECIYFHPLSNDTTISLKTPDLDKFLNSIGKTPSYVDFEVAVTVGKDQPPDLAAFVPPSAIALSDPPQKAPSENSTPESNIPVANKPETVPGKAVKQSKHAPKVEEKPQGSKQSSHTNMNVGDFVDQIINKMSTVVFSQITSETLQKSGEQQQQQLGGLVSDGVKRKLTIELESLAMKFKNAAYTEGFNSSAQAGHWNSHLMNKRCLP